MKKNFISNSPESVRMFKSDLLESLSKVHYFVPLIVYIPLIVFLIWKAYLSTQMNVFNFSGWLLLGIFIWTLTEYLLHRFIFHFQPSSDWGKQIHFIFHGVHHDYPNDTRRLVMPPSASIPLALGFYFLFNWLLPDGAVFAFFPGFIGGYLVYDMTHYTLHHASLKSPFLRSLKQHHMLHHYSDPAKGFGVSLSLWDKIFRSDFPANNMNEAIIQNKALFTKKDILITLSISVSYLLLSVLLIGFKTDQLVLILIFNTFYYAANITRKFILGFSIFIVYWILFDYMKAIPNYLFNSVSTEGLYNMEKSFFGISLNGLILTPNEYCRIHANAFSDIISGLFYLMWIPVPLVFAACLFFRNRKQFLYFSLTFVLVNLLGFVIYYLYPAAPPWYVQIYGFHFQADTPGNAAGLIRFDHYINTPVFQSLYSKSSNVFAAMPSLHSSYPLIVLYYGIKNKLRTANIFFAVVMFGIWFAAIYSGHHYVLDVVAGIICALIGIWLFNRLKENSLVSSLINKMLGVIG